jgi:dimethylargininase
MLFTHAVTRRPGPDFPQGLTTSTPPKPNPVKALEQHAVYVRRLEALGLTVTVLPAAPGFPDACFVEDTAVITPEVAVITRPGAPSRQGETASIAEALAPLRPLVEIEPPGTLDGGDVLQVGNLFFIGISDRTNEAGAHRLSTILGIHGYTSTMIRVSAGLHLKSSLNYVGKNTMLVTEYFAGHPAIADFRQIICPKNEEYAANTLLVNGTLLLPAG